MDFVDLHTHTQASDGSDTPSELVLRAALLELTAVAITDHDTIAGLEEAEAQGRDSGVEVIRGCELSVPSPYGEVHVLGLWVPRHARELEDNLEVLRLHRQERNREIVRLLQQQGLSVTYDDVLEVAGGETVGRPHIATVLMDKGYVSSIRDAFAHFLGIKGKAFVPKKTLGMEEAVSMLSRLGATVCIAHPFLMNCPQSWLEEAIVALKPLGRSALEAYHSEHSTAVEGECISLARKYGLDLTGGSDYHGSAKPGIELGIGRGRLRVPAHLLDTLKESRKRKGLPLH